MVYLIAGVLLGAAVIILAVPWSRRDPEDFSLIEFGYAWRGPRGAVVGALRVLTDLGAVGRSRRRGAVRIETSLPGDIDPLAKAVYAGLRVGPARRLLGSLAALVSPVVALVEVVRTGDVSVGLPVTFVAVVGAGWLLLLRGITIAGMRTMARPDDLDTTPSERLSLASGSASAWWFPIEFGATDAGYSGDIGGGSAGGD